MLRVPAGVAARRAPVPDLGSGTFGSAQAVDERGETATGRLPAGHTHTVAVTIDNRGVADSLPARSVVWPRG
ncbi:hypothetical protein [Amycolatopsis nalaikhensis]|uniref:Uncharacterized protein n=1 Tax=Amycolatopsis nalaikhensis TaxID=715472 RepID=A0ABY8XEA8_9PSEU|nr:hypothetical protein [Amycolatopsis sp. 2-2]WIV53942.1 hypothetical protein QP939_34420 [Amycolatopsis sp. 2-2]